MLLSFRLLIVSIILFILGQLGIAEPIRLSFQYVLNPVQAGMYSISSKLINEVDFVRNVSNLRKENLELKSENTELFSKIVDFSELERENEFLRNQLSATPRVLEEELILASVVGRDPEGLSTSFVIDKGSSHQVLIGSIIKVQNFLVGIVDEVAHNRSRVRLLTDPGLIISALNQNSEGRTRGVVRGSFGTKLVMEKILVDEEIYPGDTIITSGDDDIFPKGLLIGKVEEVKENESEILKNAILTPFLNFAKLEQVMVLKHQ